ncbi:hypothetical protein [Caminibacter pacificus]
MGTGILAISCMLFSNYLPFLKNVSVYFFWFNVFMFFFFDFLGFKVVFIF